MVNDIDSGLINLFGTSTFMLEKYDLTLYLYEGSEVELELTIHNDDTLSKKSLFYYGLGKKLYSKEFEDGGSISAEKVFHQDILGNNILLTDNTGGWVEKTTFGPFGDVISEKRRSPSSSIQHPTSYKFTGKERDKESNLDYFGARYLDYNNGRWMKPDIIQGHLESPQSLNKFAYCHNRPLFFTDPDGYDVEVVARPINVPILRLFAKHLIIYIYDEDTGQEYFASLEGSFLPGGEPTIHVYESEDFASFEKDSFAQKELDAIRTCENRTRLDIPKDQQKQFEHNLKEIISDAAKNPEGYHMALGPNSNSFADRVLGAVGYILEQIFGAVAQKSKRTDADWEIGRRMMEENVRRWENEWINNNQVGYFSTGYHTQAHMNK
ncbi:RHS repeat-associated core domain-containing protein [bacterium]|nr:RHS repeat-associated core domain-containing protein [bacterium]